jgi:hypothetical protein
MRGLIVRSTVGHMVTRGERIVIDVRIDGDEISGHASNGAREHRSFPRLAAVDRGVGLPIGRLVIAGNLPRLRHPGTVRRAVVTEGRRGGRKRVERCITQEEG